MRERRDIARRAIGTAAPWLGRLLGAALCVSLLCPSTGGYAADGGQAAKPGAASASAASAAAANGPAISAPAPDSGKRTPPYFISLRFEVAYFRTGPGKRYPITWIYHRRELPLQVEREFGNWSYVVDPAGQTGWVSQAALSNRRTFQIAGQAVEVVRAEPRDEAAAVAKMDAGALGRLRRCAAGEDWCEVEVGQGLRGWLRREAMWGLLPGEVIEK